MSASATGPEIAAAIHRREFADVRAAFAEIPPAAIADAIETLEPADRVISFRLLPRTEAAEVFEHLEPESQESLIKGLAREEVADLLNEMSPDDRTALLEELPAAVTRQALALLTAEERAVARRLLGYPEESIGRLMTPDFVALSRDWTVREAMEHIRRTGDDSETLNIVYVVDERGMLLDDLRIRQLLLADPLSRIETLMDGLRGSLLAHDDQETAVRVFAEHDRVALPVTDSRGVLLGIVTVDDVLDVAEEEATEDIQKIGGSEALDQPYMQARFAEMFRKRAGWLIALFLGQLLTMNAMGLFTAQLEQMIVLVLFVPLVISSGGNSGSQAATLVVRAMALEEVDVGDWWRVLRRELGFGLVVGVVLATLGAARIAGGRLAGEDLGREWAAVLVVLGLSLVAVVLWGVLVGSMLPFAMRRLGADPAASSTPFVATVADVTGLLIYLSIAAALIG